MLLASAPRSIRARWLGVSTLALIAVLAGPSAAGAQDGTVYIGGGSNSPDGARGEQGGDNVIVNMDAIDGGRAGRSGSGRSSSGGGTGDRPSVDFGEPFRGPAGAVLRFPPERPPESQLTVDPGEMSTSRQARRDTRASDPTPTRKPDQPQQAQQETPSATPEPKPQPPADVREPAQTVAVPDAPDLQDGGTRQGATQQAGTGQAGMDQTDMAQSETGQSTTGQSATGQSDTAAPTELTARPGRKPEPPQPTRTADRQTAAETASAPTSGGSSADGGQAMQDPEGPASDTTGSTGTTQMTAADGGSTATADRPGDGGTPAAAPETQADTASPAEPDDASVPADGPDQEMQTAATEPADTGASGDAGTPAADDTAGEASDSGDQTQTASLPPEGLPEQMRLMFADGSATLSDGAKQQLDQLADVLEDSPRQRVQLMAFAEGTEDTASQARRLSLSRALAVRTYLIDKGIRSTRMDVRALGATADQGPLDRVDIVPAKR